MSFRAAIVLILLAMVVPCTGQLQPPYPPQTTTYPDSEKAGDVRLPNGKRQIDEILKSDRDKSIQDVKQLIEAAQAIQKDLEQKESQQVLNINDIHRTEEIEKLAKRIRSRIRHD
jgi:hypothetical protein